MVCSAMRRKTGWMRAEAAGDQGPALYLPKNWTDDHIPLAAAHVPEDTGFTNKPQLAARMIARAITANVPFACLTADSVYGVGAIEQELRRAGMGYVLGVSSTHCFHSSGKAPMMGGTAAEIAAARARSIDSVYRLVPAPRGHVHKIGATSNSPSLKLKSRPMPIMANGCAAC
jgi:SRSO17 transposase